MIDGTAGPMEPLLWFNAYGKPVERVETGGPGAFAGVTDEELRNRLHSALAALRLLMQAWNTTLPDALAVFGAPAEMRREAMALNGGEYHILTDTAFKALPEYFGEPAAASIDALNAAVANANRPIGR